MENKINWQPSRNGISIQTINLYLNLNEVPRIAEEKDWYWRKPKLRSVRVPFEFSIKQEFENFTMCEYVLYWLEIYLI